MSDLDSQRAIGLVKRLAKVAKLNETPGFKEEGNSYENAEDLQVAADALDEFIDMARRIRPKDPDPCRETQLDRLVTDLWWFIENVTDDDPSRNNRFFALRERVRTT